LRNKEHLGEARRLTAAWLNIMAAGLVSAGLIPVFTALAVDGWGARARSLALLPVLAVSAGTALHMIARLVLREKTSTKKGRSLRILPSSGVAEGVINADLRDHESAFPSERDIDDVLEEFAHDPRAAIRALLQDLDTVASDQELRVSRKILGEEPRWAGSNRKSRA
jgi:hypothetical protein